MSAFRAAAVGVALGMGLASCSIEPGPDDPESVEISEESTLDLLQADAPVHIVYVPTDRTGADIASATAEQNRARFLANDQAYLDTVLDDIQTATADRYHPESITVDKTPPVDLDVDCLEGDDDSDHKIYERAARFIQANALNVILVDQIGCEWVGGYTSPDRVPILTTNSFGDLGRATVHEAVGHAGDLHHAVLVACEDEVTMQDCEMHAGDPNSLMTPVSFENDGPDNRDFTAPEMYRLGLLGPDEAIVDPEEGEYVLADITADTAEPKLLSIDGPNGLEIFLSWEPDILAGYDERCLRPGDVPGGVDNPDYLYPIWRFEDETSTMFDCLRAHARPLDHSLQVRRLVHDFELVARPDRAPDPGIEQPASGEVFEDTVVYKDDERRIIYLGPDRQNRARVLVESM